MIPNIKTERLKLRAWQIDDFAAFANFKASAKMQRHTGGAKSTAQAWDEFCAQTGQWTMRSVGVFAITLPATNKAIGFAGVWFPIDIPEPELCWSLFEGHTGHGFATEAALAARHWALSGAHVNSLISYVHPDNAASLAVVERLGASDAGLTTLRGEPRRLFRHRGTDSDGQG